MSKKQIIGLCLSVFLGMGVAIISPPADLTPQAMRGLGVLVWAVVCWIFGVAPDYVVAIAMCTLWALFRCVPFKTAFATFSDTTWWLLIGAMGLGIAVSKSGLLKRISLRIMQIFPATFNGQVLAMISAGIFVAPLVPSTTVKAAIVAPISMGISDAMGYKRKSPGAGGLFGAMYTGFVLTGPMFISASFVGYMMRGLLPRECQDQFTWTAWAVAGLAWSAIVLALMYAAIRFLYAPEEKESIPPGYAAARLAELGPAGRSEKMTAAVLATAIILWVAEPLHGINATLIALLGIVALLAGNVFDRQDFRSGMGWDNVIFIGCIINLGAVLPVLKIDQWIARSAGPIIGPLISNMYLFIVVLCLAIFAVRFLLVSFTATTAIFTVLLVPFAQQSGVNPWITGFLVFAATQVWYVLYQNSTFLTAYYAVDGEMVTHRQMVPLSFAYSAICILAALLSIPFWKYLGLIP